MFLDQLIMLTHVPSYLVPQRARLSLPLTERTTQLTLYLLSFRNFFVEVSQVPRLISLHFLLQLEFREQKFRHYQVV